MPHAATQHGGRAFREAPARGHLARAHHAGRGQHPQLVGEPPARDQVELGLAVQAFLDLRQLAQHAAVGKQAAAPEVPRGILLEERVALAPQVRLMHRDQVALDLGLAPEEPLAFGEQVVDAQVVAQEVRARGLALDDHRARPVRHPAGGIDAESRDRAGHLVRHGAASHGDEPRGREFLEAQVLARLHA